MEGKKQLEIPSSILIDGKKLEESHNGMHIHKSTIFRFEEPQSNLDADFPSRRHTVPESNDHWIKVIPKYVNLVLFKQEQQVFFCFVKLKE